MNGEKEYKDKIVSRIQSILSANPEKDYLSGFYYFIHKASSSTAYNYVNCILRYMETTQKNVEDLTLDDYTKYLIAMKDMTSSYQITVYSALKKFSTYLYASGKNMLNPMQYVDRPTFEERPDKEEKRNKGFLDKNEIQEYISAVENGVGSFRAMAKQEAWKERDLAIVLIFLTTGMRCSALFKLDVDSIDFKTKTLITRDKGGKILKHALSNDVIIKINEWLEKRMKLLCGKEEDALFISNQRTRMDQSSIARVVKKYAANIDGKEITPHKLRATYGTQVYAATGDLYLTQKAMGHSNPKTTEIYIRGQEEKNRETAAAIMSSLINF